jgi:hypothetical protein
VTQSTHSSRAPSTISTTRSRVPESYPLPPSEAASVAASTRSGYTSSSLVQLEREDERYTRSSEITSAAGSSRKSSVSLHSNSTIQPLDRSHHGDIISAVSSHSRSSRRRRAPSPYISVHTYYSEDESIIPEDSVSQIGIPRARSRYAPSAPGGYDVRRAPKYARGSQSVVEGHSARLVNHPASQLTRGRLDGWVF